jgi:Tfp pilus assembly protein PilX
VLNAQERRAAQTSAEAALTAGEGQVTRHLNRAPVGHNHLGIRASTSAVAVHKSKSQS